MPRKVEAAETGETEQVEEVEAAVEIVEPIVLEPEVLPPPAPGYVRAIYDGPAHKLVAAYDGAEYVLVRGRAADIPEGAYKALTAPRRRGQGYAQYLSIEENI